MKPYRPESILYQWGTLMFRFRRTVVVSWLVLFCLLLPFALRLPSLLQQNGFTPEHSPALEGIQKLEEGVGLSTAALELVVVSDTGENLTAGSRQQQLLKELEPLLGEPYVQDMFISPVSRKHGQDHIQRVTVQLKENTPDALRHFEEIRRIVPEIPGAEVYITGNTAVFSDMNTAVKKDIIRAELIGIPLALIILLLVYRTVVAALLPLIAGIASVGVTSGLLYFIAALDGGISNFLPNVITMLGLAVGIDYALFVVSRFREELERHQGNIGLAVAVTSATAGRAVVFSGCAVWIGFMAMGFIGLPIFRSFAIGGLAVVLISVLAANTLLPALLGWLGSRVNSLPVFRQQSSGSVQGPSGLWRRIAAFVMARPLRISILAAAGLVLAMLPLKNMKVGIPEAEILPPSYESRHGYDLIKQAYDERELNPIIVAAELPGPYHTPESIRAVKQYTDQIRSMPQVYRVESYVSLGRGREELTSDYLARPEIRERLEASHLASGNMAVVAVVPKTAEEETARELVAELRSLQPEALTAYVTGNPALKLDILEEMTRGIPFVIGFVFLTTYIVLFAAFRSVLLPLKAVIMNVLSLGAGLGIVVLVFQEGYGAGLLGVTYTGTIFALLPILVFCVVFGISMDYEVILLSRIMEGYQATGDNERSTEEGLEKTGGLITGAALILSVVVGAFMFTDNEVMKALGLGLTVAVLLDATVVRILLVPAFMKLLGRANWWSPVRLGLFRKRSDHPDLTGSRDM